MLGLENVSVFGHIKQWREGEWIQSVRPSTNRTEASVQKEDLPWGGGGRQLVFGVRNHLISIRTVPELGTLLSLAGERTPPPPTYELLWRPSQSKGEENANAGIFPAVPHTQAFWETPEGTLCWVGLDWIAAWSLHTGGSAKPQLPQENGQCSCCQKSFISLSSDSSLSKANLFSLVLR